MFSYIAFKALRAKKQGWVSPVMGTPWSPESTPWGVFLGASTDAAHVDAGVGIFASDYEEASRYGNDVFAVFPDPAAHIVLGTSGWRAEKAYVLGKVESPLDAARYVAAAYNAGYPQVPDIAFWAATETREPSMAAIIDKYVDKLISTKGGLIPNIRTVKMVAEALCKVGDAAAEKLIQLFQAIDEALSFVIASLPTANFSVSVQLTVLLAVIARIRTLNSTEMYMRVAETLHKYPPEIVQEVLDEFTGHQSAQVRRALVLNAAKEQSTLLIVERLMTDKSELVRSWVAGKIGILGEDGLPALKFMARTENNASVLKNIAVAACQIGEPASDIIKKMACHPDKNVRAQVALYVDKSCKDALTLLDILANDKEWSVRQNVAKNCEQFGKVTENILRRLVVDLNSTVAIYAINVTARLKLFDVLVDAWDAAPNYRWVIASVVKNRAGIPAELVHRVTSRSGSA